MRLDAWLARMQPQFSRSHWQRLIAAGQVQIDGVAASGGKTLLLAGHRVTASLEPPASETAFRAEPVPLAVIDEDDALIVLDKPAGLVVHPAAGHWGGTLLNGLLHRWPALAELPRAGIVHRLDKDTSGLMVVAKTAQAQWHLVRQLQDKTAGRSYLALVHGALRGEGRIDAPIGRDPRHRTRMAVVARGGKPAATRYRVLATGQWDGAPVTLLACELETGRTHQIRVHLAQQAHPLVGDALYGGRGFARQALHAWRLRLVHPQSGAQRDWRSALPTDLRQLFAAAQVDGGLDAID
jgi:23S rRNA pseudouridine1911/1915/1917 synthase